MILTAFATLLLALAAMSPGIILGRSGTLDIGRLASLAAASLAVTMVIVAVAGTALHAMTGWSLSACAMLPVSVVLALGAWLRTRGDRLVLQLEWQGIAVAAAFVLYGVLVYSVSVTDLPDGALRIHAWYNADWFKHIGHTFAIADYGVPARDIFADGRPLHYYWLSHILPGAGTALGGDAWSALFTANAIYATLLAATLFGTVRLSGASSNVSGVIAALATFISGTPKVWLTLLRPGGYESLMFGPYVPPEPALLPLALYVPQHAFALSLLLGWAVTTLGKEKPTRELRLFVLAALATVMTVSTLFGAAILATYALVQLSRRELRAIPELMVVAITAGLLVLLLGVVMLGNANGYQSSLVIGLPRENGVVERAMTSALAPVWNAGLPVVVCFFPLLRWKPADEASRNARIFALSLLLAAILVASAAEIAVGDLVGHEVRLRVLNLIAVSVAIVGGWLVSRAWARGRLSKTLAVVTLAILVVAAAPTSVIRTLWHGNGLDGYTTIVPPDDRAILSALREQSGSRDIVLQYPEAPQISIPPGKDIWSAVLAGRTNFASPRASDRNANMPRIAFASRFFSGQEMSIPQAIDWIYLSRTLHPTSYDLLVKRLGQDRQWFKSACRPDACLFRRRAGV